MKHFIFFLFFLLTTPLFANEAWNAIKTYQYGDDFQPLLTVEAEIRQTLASPETKAQAAARLAALLDDDTTAPGRQFAFMQLRLVGGAAEVPRLSEWLNRPEDAENARLTLTDILCEESLVPLRQALETIKGQALVGIIGSLASRKDRLSIPVFIRLLDDSDKDVAAAAASALGQFGAEGRDALLKAKDVTFVASALIGIANELVDQGKPEEAAQLFAVYSDKKYPVGLRRAAFQGQLRTLSPEQQEQTIAKWFFEDDPAKNDIAASRLKQLSPSQFDELFSKVAEMNSRAKIVFLELAVQQQSEKLMTQLRKTLETGNETERVSALRALGQMGDPEAIPLLIALLKDTSIQDEAAEALKKFPKTAVEAPLIQVLGQADIRIKVLDIMSDLKCYDAIDPLIVMAQSEDAAVFVPVIATLGRICDPDDSDIPRMLRLYLASRPGPHRENVERAIVIICENMPDPAARAEILLKHLRNPEGALPEDTLATVFPLLGRFGNQQVADLIFPFLTSDQFFLQQAAIRALCNWPNADHKDKLWEIATTSSSPQYSQWALRAYIRVVTLRSDRPESETLTMLQNAMKAANNDADRRLCLNRASTVRTMEAVQWIAAYLDNPALAQAACEALAELGRHRFLREPNKEVFDPILIKVENTARDNQIIESVRRSRLGM